MASEWRHVTFGETIDFCSNKKPAATAALDSYISTENMIPNFGGVSEAASLPSSGSVSQFEIGDTLFSNIRTYFLKVWRANFKGTCSPDVLVFRPKSKNEMHSGYLHHLCRWDAFTNYSVRTSKGAKMPRGDKEALSRFGFQLPPLNEQLSITEVLDALEDQIVLLRESNKTLESIAQAIFKSWFVDFDPVTAKAAGLVPGGIDEATAALFPDSFDASPLGQMPKGWSISTIEEIAHRVGMGPFGSNIKVETFVDSGIPVISGQHLKQLLIEDGAFNFITVDHARKLSNSCVQRGDVIFTHAGNIGQVALLAEGSLYDRYVLSQRQFFLRCDQEAMCPEWITYYFRSTQGQHQLLANASQVGVPSIARPVTYLKSIRFLKPPMQLIKRFSEISDVLNKSVMANRSEIKTLSELRDTLLPRLISGKLRIPETQEAVEEMA